MSLMDMKEMVNKRIETCVSTLEELKQQQLLLTENADRVKLDISNCTTKNEKLVSTKEKQLLRQVEVITAHQKSLLETQIANTLHVKGSLQMTQHILSHCTKEDKETLKKVIEAKIPSAKLVPSLHLVSVQLDGRILEAAIRDLGKVSVPDTIIHHHSSVLPARIEDYEDSDHDVLHKSLRGSHSSTSPLKIVVKFPQLPGKSWLATSNKEEALCRSWLAGLNIDRENKCERTSCNEFHYLDMESSPNSLSLRTSPLKNRSLRTSECSSIEIIEPPYQVNGSTAVLNPSPYQLALKNDGGATLNTSSFLSAGNKDSSDLSLDLDIDDLDVSHWLSKTDITSHTRSPPNGCSSSSSATQAKLLALQHMSEIWTSRQDQWLFHSQRKSLGSRNCASKSGVHYDPPTSSWLLREDRIDSSSTRPNTWLLRKFQSERLRNQASNETSMSEENRLSPKSVDLHGTLQDSMSSMPAGNLPHKNMSVDLPGALKELCGLMPEFKALQLQQAASQIDKENDTRNWVNKRSQSLGTDASTEEVGSYRSFFLNPANHIDYQRWLSHNQ